MSWKLKLNRIIHLSLILSVLVLLNSITGCYYYGVTTKENLIPEDIRWEDFNGKYLILHSGNEAWHMHLKSIDSSIMECYLSTLPDNHKLYLTTNPNRDNRFIKFSSKNYQGDVLNEVHLYASGVNRSSDSLATVHFFLIKKMEIYRYSPGHSTASFILPSVLVPVGTAGLLALIVALTKSSCPYVYINSHNNYEFAGEIFSGAVYPSLERNDFLPLSGFEPSEGKYLVKIANKLPEHQYINCAELWVVSHPPNSRVLADKEGILHTVSSPLPPETAVSSGNNDLSGLLAQADERSFKFDEDTSATRDTCARNSLVLTFPVPAERDSGKLIIRARNSYWGDYIFGEFFKQFGNKYESWVRKQGKSNPERPLKWKQDQVLPLMVYLETNDGWQFVDYFDLAGPLAFREMIMPLDISQALKNNQEDAARLRIKIVTGFMFWELDYVSMDFSPDLPVSLNAIKPSSAVTESGNDAGKLIMSDDNKYYEQPDIGNEVLLVYGSPADLPGVKRSLFLHTKGYYLHIRHYRNRPEVTDLKTFRIPGRLSQFSFDRFTELRNRYAAKYRSPAKE